MPGEDRLHEEPQRDGFPAADSTDHEEILGRIAQRHLHTSPGDAGFPRFQNISVSAPGGTNILGEITRFSGHAASSSGM